MSETLPPNQEVTPDQLALVADHLCHGLFQTTLTDGGYQHLQERLSEIAGTSEYSATEVVVQLMFTDPAERPVEPGEFTWLGFLGAAIFEPDSANLGIQSMFYTNDGRDINDMKRFQNTPTIVLSKEDVRWNEITEPVHPPDSLESDDQTS